MRTTEGVLLGSAAFSLLTGAIYWFVGHESAGTIMLLTMAVGLLIAAAYLWVVRRRTSLAADQRETRPSDLRGEQVGVFASHSVWPAMLALGCAVGLTGLIYGWWLAVLGAAGVTVALVGLARDDPGSAGQGGSAARSR